jgi:hypothetical protein
VAATIQPAVRLVAAAPTRPRPGRLRGRGAVGSGWLPSSPEAAGSGLAGGVCSFTNAPYFVFAVLIALKGADDAVQACLTRLKAGCGLHVKTDRMRPA